MKRCIAISRICLLHGRFFCAQSDVLGIAYDMSYESAKSMLEGKGFVLDDSSSDWVKVFWGSWAGHEDWLSIFVSIEGTIDTWEHEVTTDWDDDWIDDVMGITVNMQQIDPEFDEELDSYIIHFENGRALYRYDDYSGNLVLDYGGY